MANIVINGVTFSGAPGATGTPNAPSSIAAKVRKIGTVREAASGARTFVYRGYKLEWDIQWENVSDLTRGAVANIATNSGTYTFTDVGGNNYTVHTENDDHQEETTFTDASGIQYYNCSITLRQV